MPKALTKFILFHFYGIQISSENKKNNEDISICRYKHGAKGAFCFSLDFEKPPPKQIKGTKISCEAVPEILKLADYYGIPLTWATCGDIVVSDELGWRNSFERILSSKVEHDLGSHTFDHEDISACSYEKAEAEIAKSIQVFGENRPRSFVFPKNRIKHLDVLERLGFVTYRGAESKLGYPDRLCGLWNISQTYYIGRKSSSMRGYGLTLLLLVLVDIAIENGCVLHIWSHPWHMSVNGDAKKFSKIVLNPLFNYARRKREENLLWISTMRELANYCESLKNCTILECKRTNKEVSVAIRCEIKNGKFDFPPVVTIKIPIPKGKHFSRAYVDENELKHSINCYVAKHGEKSLVLTLTFEKPVKKIRVSSDN